MSAYSEMTVRFRQQAGEPWTTVKINEAKHSMVKVLERAAERVFPVEDAELEASKHRRFLAMMAARKKRNVQRGT
jgi:hypothetical protein